MTLFRSLLALLLLGLLAYTLPVLAEHGPNYLPIFFGQITEGGWPGQFNLDFSALLLLAAVWVAWRDRVSVRGLLFAALTLLLGSIFLTGYLLYLSVRHRGDFAAMLLGGQRAERST